MFYQGNPEKARKKELCKLAWLRKEKKSRWILARKIAHHFVTVMPHYQWRIWRYSIESWGSKRKNELGNNSEKKTFPSSISACFDSVIKYFPRFSQSCLKITQIEWERKENEVEKLNNINFTQLSAWRHASSSCVIMFMIVWFFLLASFGKGHHVIKISRRDFTSCTNDLTLTNIL